MGSTPIQTHEMDIWSDGINIFQKHEMEIWYLIWDQDLPKNEMDI